MTKRGRPRKYGSPTAKAHHDVVKWRRRRQQSRAARSNEIRFIESHFTAVISRQASQHNNFTGQRLGVLADAAANPQYACEYHVCQTGTIDGGTADSSRIYMSFNEPKDTSVEPVALSFGERWSPQESAQAMDSPTTPESEARVVSDLPLAGDSCFSRPSIGRAGSPDTMMDIADSAGSQMEPSPEKINVDGSKVDKNDPSTCDPFVSDLSDEETPSEVEHEDNDPHDSLSAYDSELESLHSAVQNPEESSNTARSPCNYEVAKTFLENTWSQSCSCSAQERRVPDGQNIHNLDDMSKYWQDLGVSDSLGTTPAPLETDSADHSEADEDVDEVTKRPIDWSAILSGGDHRPTLDIERSEVHAPSITRTWDIDSVISWASCLSVNRGLYISYHPAFSRNINSSVHVFHQKTPLHSIPHFRLGSGRQSPQFGVYIFFPNMCHPHRKTTYLSNEERRMFIDQMLLPAIRRTCPPDVLQHHPRSFEDVESKAYSRQRETCGGMVRSQIDMHHYLPHEYLESIWDRMCRKAMGPATL